MLYSGTCFDLDDVTHYLRHCIMRYYYYYYYYY